MSNVNEDKKPYHNVKIPCRISYPALAEMSKGDDTYKASYQVEVRIDEADKDTQLAIRKAMKACWVDSQGDEVSKWRPNFQVEGFFGKHLSADGQDGFPLRSGKLRGKEEYEGIVYMKASNQRDQPKCAVVVEANGKKGIRYLENANEIRDELYAGCEANVHVDFYVNKPKSNNVKPGICVSLRGVVKTGAGERIAGAPEVDFGEYGEEIQTNSSADDVDFGDL